MSSSNGSNGSSNGSSGKGLSSLADLGAPHWFCEYDRRNRKEFRGVKRRISALEQSAIASGGDAGHTSGRAAGGKWGAFLGALMAVFASTVQTHCVGSSGATVDEQGVQGQRSR